MPKKRTRKQKQNVHHSFLISWSRDGENNPNGKRVKREMKIEAEADLAVVSVKKDIARSLALASLIIASELVLYLALK